MANKISEEDFLAEIRAIADAETIFVRAECACGQMYASASQLRVDGRTIVAVQQPKEQTGYQHTVLKLCLPAPEYAVYRRIVNEFGKVALRVSWITDNVEIYAAVFSDTLAFELSGDLTLQVQ
jgi:hypothetical protein